MPPRCPVAFLRMQEAERKAGGILFLNDEKIKISVTIFLLDIFKFFFILLSTMLRNIIEFKKSNIMKIS